MKKITVLIAITVLMTVNVIAQVPYKENAIIDKQTVPGYSIVLPDLDPAVVESALAEYIGAKSGKASGFAYYNNLNIPKIGTRNYDIYTKVVREGKKKDNKAKVYFVVTKGNMNPMDDAADFAEVANIKVYLEEFIPFANGHNVKQKISDLNKNLDKEQKKLSSALKQREKAQKKLEDMGKDISTRQTKVSDLQNELNKANTLLQQFKK
ncbi:hypothetical protein LJC68_03970 [Bacteroidales bacterium OttesenSCG-928-B11]|nr:hypothetical protein [Bacteroidales bacterium OttesenSCG-928-E04]MDL2309117.1 hypothetical protein [Bacteroidales bacterium OttesenSCG-928-C03]MDL2312016.1 hypothetical protein [Bacteroidales bacterium OttesenSCG-928-B11]